MNRRGEELLKKICCLDTPKPSVNLESANLIRELLDVFLGDAGNGIPAAGNALRLRIMSLLIRSVSAANMVPGSLQVR